MRGAVSERVFEFMDDQTISIDTQAIQGDWPSRYVLAQSLEFVTLMGFTHH
jgi:hypothetical protein